MNGEIQGAGQVLTFSKGSAEHVTGRYAGGAQLDLENYWDPMLTAEATCEDAWFPVFQDVALPVINEQGRHPSTDSVAARWAESRSRAQRRSTRLRLL